MFSRSFHQNSWNSEVETAWISLICWQHKTSNAHYTLKKRRTYLINNAAHVQGILDWEVNATKLRHKCLGIPQLGLILYQLEFKFCHSQCHCCSCFVFSAMKKMKYRGFSPYATFGTWKKFALAKNRISKIFILCTQ